MIYKIIYAPILRSGPSFINADSPEHARRMFGAGLSETDKALIVVREHATFRSNAARRRTAQKKDGEI